jgi:hypothetical protein
MFEENIVSHNYLKDLVKLIGMEGLSGQSLLFINRLTNKDYATLSD